LIGQITERVTLPIDKELFILDTIFQKYTPRIEGLCFVEHKRYPIDKSSLRPKEKYSDTPFHPMLSVEAVALIITSFIYDHNPEIGLLNKNKYLSEGGKSYYKSNNLSDMEIILSYFETRDNIEAGDIATISMVLDKIKKIVGQFITDSNRYKVFHIDYENSDFTIHYGLDIRIIRFEELEHGNVIDPYLISDYSDTVPDDYVYCEYVDLKSLGLKRI